MMQRKNIQIFRVYAQAHGVRSYYTIEKVK